MMYYSVDGTWSLDIQQLHKINFRKVFLNVCIFTIFTLSETEESIPKFSTHSGAVALRSKAALGFFLFMLVVNYVNKDTKLNFWPVKINTAYISKV